jgi:hypothetical protein
LNIKVDLGEMQKTGTFYRCKRKNWSSLLVTGMENCHLPEIISGEAPATTQLPELTLVVVNTV